MANFEAVDKRLKTVASRAKGKFGIMSDCENYLNEFIEHGVKVLSSQGFLGNETELRKAESNLVRFVNAMKDEARNQKLAVLHEFTFMNAKARLCPLWPFCE